MEKFGLLSHNIVTTTEPIPIRGIIIIENGIITEIFPIPSNWDDEHAIGQFGHIQIMFVWISYSFSLVARCIHHVTCHMLSKLMCFPCMCVLFVQDWVLSQWDVQSCPIQVICMILEIFNGFQVLSERAHPGSGHHPYPQAG